MTEKKRIKSDAAARWASYQVPALPHAGALEQALRTVRAMTPAQIVKSSVEAGIHRPGGKRLTKNYGG